MTCQPSKRKDHSPYSPSLHYPSAPAPVRQEPRNQEDSGGRKQARSHDNNAVAQTSQGPLTYGPLKPISGRNCGEESHAMLVLTSGAHWAQRTSLRREEGKSLSLWAGKTTQ